MTAQSMTVTLPPEVARALNEVGLEYLEDIVTRGLRSFRIERALQRYSDGGISFGAAAGLAGVGQSELARHAYARGMEPPFDESMLTEELG